MSNSKAYRDYTIPKEDYNELYWFCRKYPKNRERLANCYGTHTPQHDMYGKSTVISKPTETNALKAEKYRHDCELIEQAAKEAGGEILAMYILRNVTEAKMPYERLGNVPIGRQQFYEIRRKFFFILWNLKNNF